MADRSILARPTGKAPHFVDDRMNRRAPIGWLPTEVARAQADAADALKLVSKGPTAARVLEADLALRRIRTLDDLADNLAHVVARANPLSPEGTAIRAAMDITTATFGKTTRAAPTAPPLVQLEAPVLATIGIEVDPSTMAEVEHLPTFVAVANPPEKQPVPASVTTAPPHAVQWRTAYTWADISWQYWQRCSERFRNELGERAVAAVLAKVEALVLADVIAAGTAGAALDTATSDTVLDGLADQLDAVAATGMTPNLVIAAAGVALQVGAAIGNAPNAEGLTVIGSPGVPAGRAIITSTGAVAFYSTPVERLEQGNVDQLGQDIGVFAEACAVLRLPEAVRVTAAPTP